MKRLLIRKLILPDNFEEGTAGIASASQLVESTGSYSIECGTSLYPTLTGVFKIKTKEEPRKETVIEKLHRIARGHKEALDKLDDS